MSRTIWILVLALAVSITAPVLAEEDTGISSTPAPATDHPSGSEHPAASPAAPAAPDAAAPATPDAAAPVTTDAAAPAAATPPPTPPALKPITITFSGDLTGLGTEGTPAMITVQDRYGVKKEISVPTEAKIAQGGSSKTLTDLKVGDKLTVEYTYDVATGKRVAQSINVGEAAAANR